MYYPYYLNQREVEVYEAQIKKAPILTLLQRQKSKKVIVDLKYLRTISEVQEMSNDFVQTM